MARGKNYDKALFAIVIACFLLRAALLSGPTYYAEENISIAESLAMRAGGARPHADFIHSHPPFNLYAISTFSEIAGIADPILSAKILSLLLSAGIAVFLHLLGGALSAALFASSVAFFSWYSLSIPAIPLAFLLSAFFFLWKKTQGNSQIACLALAVCAVFTEFSALLAIALILAFEGPENKPKKAVFFLALLLLSGALALLLDGATGGAFLSQTVFRQAQGRFISPPFWWIIPNFKEAVFSLLLPSLPLIAILIIFGRKSLLFPASVSLALILALPKLSNNTLQFLIPFLALSAGNEGSKKRILPALLALSLVFSLSVLVPSGEFSGKTPGLERISESLATEASGLEAPEIWGSPEASLLSLRTGIPVSENFFESTPGTIASLGNVSKAPRPEFLVISDYYGSWDVYNLSLDEYSPLIYLAEEPRVGGIKIYKRKPAN